MNGQLISETIRICQHVQNVRQVMFPHNGYMNWHAENSVPSYCIWYCKVLIMATTVLNCMKSITVGTHYNMNAGAQKFPIVPFHKSQDTLLHLALNDEIQNTLFTELPYVKQALWVGFDWQSGSGSADLNWSVLIKHIGVHPLPATQPTLIGHAQFIKPHPSQFSVPHVPHCMHGNGEICIN